MAKIKSKIKYLLALVPAFGITSVTAQESEPSSAGSSEAAGTQEVLVGKLDHFQTILGLFCSDPTVGLNSSSKNKKHTCPYRFDFNNLSVCLLCVCLSKSVCLSESVCPCLFD